MSALYCFVQLSLYVLHKQYFSHLPIFMGLVSFP